MEAKSNKCKEVSMVALENKRRIRDLPPKGASSQPHPNNGKFADQGTRRVPVPEGHQVRKEIKEPKRQRRDVSKRSRAGPCTSVHLGPLDGGESNYR